MSVTFHRESWGVFAPDAAPLWPAHWKEVARDRDAIKLKPDVRQYEQLEREGALHIVTARELGTVVGYWIGIVRPHLHYVDSLTAFTDIYYLSPTHRRNGTGRTLFAEVERSLKDRGVQRIFTATKVHLDHSALFESLGYNRVETVFSKLLEG